jgi:hypothetical protein
MIWGELVNSVRNLHLHLVQDFAVDPALYTRDIPVAEVPIPFPESVDDFEEWEEPAVPADLQDLLPLHPVERVMIEGPVLPIQIIRFRNVREIRSLFDAVLILEKEWLEKTGNFSNERIGAVRSFLKAEELKLSVRAGFRVLAPTKELKS